MQPSGDWAYSVEHFIRQYLPSQTPLESDPDCTFALVSASELYAPNGFYYDGDYEHSELWEEVTAPMSSNFEATLISVMPGRLLSVRFDDGTVSRVRVYECSTAAELEEFTKTWRSEIPQSCRMRTG